MVPTYLGFIDGPFVPHNLISTQESPVPLLKFQMVSRLKILMASGSKKGTQIYFIFLSKALENVPPTGPLWRERGTFTGHYAYLSKTSSFGFPNKGAFPQVPLRWVLTERCPTTRALLYSSIKVPGIWTAPPPHTRFPSDGKGPPWREMPASGDFLNISSRIPSEGAPLEAPSTEPLQREMLHPQSPLHPALKVPSRRALLQVPQMGPLWKEMPVSRAFSTYPSGSLARGKGALPPGPLHGFEISNDLYII